MDAGRGNQISYPDRSDSERIHDRIGGLYLAGLWSLGLVEGILWYVVNKMSRGAKVPIQVRIAQRRIQEAPLATSWSWASLRGEDAEINSSSTEIETLSHTAYWQSRWMQM